MSIYGNVQPNIRPGLDGMTSLVPGLDELLGTPQAALRKVGGVDVLDRSSQYTGQISGLNGNLGGSWFNRQAMFGGIDPETGAPVGGWAPTAVTAVSSLMGGYLGLKQYGMAKKQLNESKRQFNLNYEQQRKTTNTRLEDRQRARVASNADAYQSVGSYMKQHGV